jgi:hypothetical protein
MRNNPLHIFGLIILFFLFSNLSTGFAGIDGGRTKSVQDDRTQHHDAGRAIGHSDAAIPVLLQNTDKGTEKSESNAEPGSSAPDQSTTRPKVPGKSDELTPFKPSEEIEADQAVDFPYDI